jgi:hypothetical protein
LRSIHATLEGGKSSSSDSVKKDDDSMFGKFKDFVGK